MSESIYRREVATRTKGLQIEWSRCASENHQDGGEIQMSNLSLAARVRAGAKFLDGVYGRKWRRKVKVRSLDIRSSTSCILGQTDGDYLAHRIRLKLTRLAAAKLGFTCDEYERHGIMDDLTLAWKRFFRAERRKSK